MARGAKNAKQRRKVLAELKEIRSLVGDLQRVWDVRATVYVDPAKRTEPGQWRRERQADEYPEETPDAWAYVYNASDELIKKLYALREQAYTRYHEIQDARADRSGGDA